MDDSKSTKHEVNDPEALRKAYLHSKDLGPKSYGAVGQHVPAPTHYVDELSFMK